MKSQEAPPSYFLDVLVEFNRVLQDELYSFLCPSPSFYIGLFIYLYTISSVFLISLSLSRSMSCCPSRFSLRSFTSHLATVPDRVAGALLVHRFVREDSSTVANRVPRNIVADGRFPSSEDTGLEQGTSLIEHSKTPEFLLASLLDPTRHYGLELNS